MKKESKKKRKQNMKRRANLCMQTQNLLIRAIKITTTEAVDGEDVMAIVVEDEVDNMTKPTMIKTLTSQRSFALDVTKADITHRPVLIDS